MADEGSGLLEDGGHKPENFFSEPLSLSFFSSPFPFLACSLAFSLFLFFISFSLFLSKKHVWLQLSFYSSSLRLSSALPHVQPAV